MSLSTGITYRSKKDSKMRYIIFDMEWNQPAAHDSAITELRHGEIIQIGFFVLDEALEILHSEKINIRPVCYTVMNKYVSALTGITQQDIDKGISFRKAIGIMASYFDGDTVIITWGDDDMPLLRDNLRYHGIDDIKLPVHYNLQQIYAAQTQTSFRQTGLKTAIESLGIVTDIQAHEALNDAYMTVLIARRLDLARGIADYCKRPKKDREKENEERKRLHQPWLTESPVFTEDIPYSGKFEGMAAKCRKTVLTCPVCSRALSQSVLCRQGKLSFISKAECEGHVSWFTRFELADGCIKAACFEMNDVFERIYFNRLRGREKRLKYKEMYRPSALKGGKRKKQEKKSND